ncbi:hypothetical protein FISHEDRAFT_70932 [Fistulina hepatica ATCC 64428]|uniref:Homeobox domain-containing protein n=1 Tax=Fistulina hepatica ATCC 64428 TaxID=1128425 RepID=A0A0D7AHS9_9AGAR|nr:hypothetical protein FISHEDRAFT_70932 [Fistulina hepatica ATCC 64428]
MYNPRTLENIRSLSRKILASLSCKILASCPDFALVHKHREQPVLLGELPPIDLSRIRTRLAHFDRLSVRTRRLFLDVFCEQAAPLAGTVRQACQKISLQLPDSGIPVLEKLQSHLYRGHMERLEAAFLSHVEKIYSEKVRLSIEQASKPKFNHRYAAVLVQYYEQNRYPTQKDRRLLAQITGMTERQIHCWFQNRRSRRGDANTPLTQRSGNNHQLASTSRDRMVNHLEGLSSSMNSGRKVSLHHLPTPPPESRKTSVAVPSSPSMTPAFGANGEIDVSRDRLEQYLQRELPNSLFGLRKHRIGSNNLTGVLGSEPLITIVSDGSGHHFTPSGADFAAPTPSYAFPTSYNSDYADPFESARDPTRPPHFSVPWSRTPAARRRSEILPDEQIDELCTQFQGLQVRDGKVPKVPVALRDVIKDFPQGYAARLGVTSFVHPGRSLAMVAQDGHVVPRQLPVPIIATECGPPAAVVNVPLTTSADVTSISPAMLALPKTRLRPRRPLHAPVIHPQDFIAGPGETVWDAIGRSEPSNLPLPDVRQEPCWMPMAPTTGNDGFASEPDVAALLAQCDFKIDLDSALLNSLSGEQGPPIDSIFGDVLLDEITYRDVASFNTSVLNESVMLDAATGEAGTFDATEVFRGTAFDDPAYDLTSSYLARTPGNLSRQSSVSSLSSNTSSGSSFSDVSVASSASSLTSSPRSGATWVSSRESSPGYAETSRNLYHRQESGLVNQVPATVQPMDFLQLRLPSGQALSDSGLSPLDMEYNAGVFGFETNSTAFQAPVMDTDLFAMDSGWSVMLPKIMHADKLTGFIALPAPQPCLFAIAFYRTGPVVPLPCFDPGWSIVDLGMAYVLDLEPL